MGKKQNIFKILLFTFFGAAAAGYLAGTLYGSSGKSTAYAVEGGRISSVDVSTLVLTKNVYTASEEEISEAAEQTGQDVEDVRAQMAEVLEEKSLGELRKEALQKVTEAAEVFEMSEDAAISYEEQAVAAYEELREQFNSTDISEIYTLFSTSEEQVRADARDMLAERMAVGMLIDDNGLMPSDEEMDTSIGALAGEEGVSTEDYLEEYGEDYARYQVLYRTAADFVIEHAAVEEVPAEG
jgi:hypothetical protein